MMFCFGTMTVTICAQNKPSYQETADWIKSHFDLLGSEDGRLNYSGITMNDCVLKYTETYSPRYGTESTIDYTVFLHDVDKITVFSNNTLTLATKTTSVGRVVNGHISDNHGYVDLQNRKSGVDASDLAPRLKNALQNAVDICKAKTSGEPF